ncbi:SulP family inorganic anion transporter [Streptomyces cathayae]|uniref:SulP family inorganic anion transporter n=1 Tax=Streptomyces cathayae TaxID=3031124 RepID=A0ABY8K1T3_9ACTN|nr:SulP family inorganic anion transporter [Streptomyces sp. HUAS 5]WGD41604.1 SulP family inorganic anion transporter [Streptomyces sp. HUAS 5]
MPTCVPTTHASDPNRTGRAHPPHSPPPTGPRRLRIAGADLSAAVAVFLIALPLSLGIALATGAPLQAGLVAAAVGGLVAGRLGGSPLQVSGPAAGLTVVTADIIQQYGWRTTCAITVLAGLSQLGLGCLRVARGALAVSPAIVHGMLAGIGVTIAVAQVHIVLGGTPQSSVPDNLRALPAQLANLDPAAVAVSVLTLTLLLLWPRIPGRAGRLLRRVPAALVAVTGATAVATAAGLVLAEVDLPSWRSHALAGLPEGPVLGLVAAVLTTTLVCSVQSLLGAVAVDKMVSRRPGPGHGPRSDLDRELLGQGTANIASGCLGGLPVAGVAVRSSANVNAGAVSRNSTMLHGVLVVVAALLMVPILEFIPLASLAALVMAVGIQMVSLHHIRTVTRHREVLVYAVTALGVVSAGVLEGVALGIAAAVGVALHRLTRTRITHEEKKGVHHVHVRGQLTFLAVPRLSRSLHLVPPGATTVVTLDGSFMDHAAYEALQDWQNTHTARGGAVEITGRRPGAGVRIAEPAVLAAAPAASTPDGTDAADPTTGAECRCRPWTAWRNHQCEPPRSVLPGDFVPTGGSVPNDDRSVHDMHGVHDVPGAPGAPSSPGFHSGSGGRAIRSGTGGLLHEGDAPRAVGTSGAGGPEVPRAETGQELVRGLSTFQRSTAPLVRGEPARLAREGQQPTQLFLTCADSRLVTSMITSSGPGDLFVVRNVGNLVPPPGEESGDDSVAAALEYAVEVLAVRSITVCGHSGCGAVQALLDPEPDGARTPLRRWLRHGLPSLERAGGGHGPWARLGERASADPAERLCLANVVQQLDHLRAHESVARALKDGNLTLHGMYFHVGEAQAYLLTETAGEGRFDRVRAADLAR